MAYGRKPKSGLMVAIGVDKDMPKPPRSPEDSEDRRSPFADEGEGIPPEAVGYHTGEERCGSCGYWGEDGSCSKLKMQVAEADHCHLFMPGGPADSETVLREEGQPV